MGFMSSYRKRPEPQSLEGVRCPACGGGLYVSRA
jgi:hypothetical protein